MSRIVLLVSLLVGFGLSAGPAAAATIVVDTPADGDDGECAVDCTLREAVATASPGDTIVVPAGTYRLTLGIITLDRDLTVTGEGARHTVVRGATPPQRVFMIETGATVEIAALSVSLEAGLPNGGGIRNEGDLTLRDCWLRDAFGPLDLGGGALRNTPAGTLTIENCTISDNSAEFGGGIFNEGVLVLEAVTISDNSNAFAGGGIINSGGTITIDGSTIVDNIAQIQGGANIENGHGTVVIRNSVVAGGVGGADCTGVIDASDGFNVDGDGSCVGAGGTGNFTADPKLGPLDDNGGPVPTRAPASDSPLLDAGNPALPGSAAEACGLVDARGVARPQGGACDVGAFELALGQACAGGAADDADGDGVCAAVDNCPDGFNPGQGPVAFPHGVVAEAIDRFGWGEPEDVTFVRGDLDAVDAYVTNGGGDLSGADGLTDGLEPASGAGFWYLVRLGGACTAGSWQTRPGGQPDRDQTLP